MTDGNGIFDFLNKVVQPARSSVFFHLLVPKKIVAFQKPIAKTDIIGRRQIADRRFDFIDGAHTGNLADSSMGLKPTRSAYFFPTLSPMRNSMLFSVFLIFSSSRFIASTGDSSDRMRRSAWMRGSSSG